MIKALCGGPADSRVTDASFFEGMLCEADPTNTTAWHCKYLSSFELREMNLQNPDLKFRQQQQQRS